MQFDPTPAGPAARNPGKASGGIGAAVAALITLGTAFGLPITEGQQSAILGAVAVIVPLIVGWWTDRRTTPYVDPRDRAGQTLVPAPIRSVGDSNPGGEA